MALRQTQEFKLQTGLNPTQIQTIKFVQMTSQEFEDSVKEQLEENPFLEEDEEKELEEDPTPSYRYRSDITREAYPAGYETVSQFETLQDSLKTQLGFVELDDLDRKIGEYIIGTIDDDGFLRTTTDSIYNLLVFNLGIDTTEENVERILEIIQGFDPVGVGARDLRECLLIQLRRKSATPAVENAIRLLEVAFDDFSNKHYDAVKRRCHLTDDELREANAVILHLTPKPSVDNADFVEDKAKQIVPDFVVRLVDDKIVLTLPRYNIPELRINKGYIAEQKNIHFVREEDRKEMEAYNTQKYNAAKSFIEAVKQRYNTLRLTMQAIIDLQEKYFYSGETSDLKPLILKEIADRAGFDISTISRVVQHRYVDTEWGLKPLKFFFSEGMQTSEGEQISNREVKEALKEVIEKEDKRNPLSDDALTIALTEQGYRVARRTVAKYREQLNIPPGRLRKTI